MSRRVLLATLSVLLAALALPERSAAQAACYECVNRSCYYATTGHTGGNACSSGTTCTGSGCYTSCAVTGSCQGSCDPAQPMLCKIKIPTAFRDTTPNGQPAAFFKESTLSAPQASTAPAATCSSVT